MYNEEFWNWVEKHRNEDPTRLRLKMNGQEEWISDAITHIENDRKSRKKFQAEGVSEDIMPKLLTVGISIEQATSASLALIHREIALGLNPKPKKILDMTCGLGIDASILATLPDSKVTAIERDERIATVAAENYKSRSNIEIVCSDSVKFIESTKCYYDLIFIDPARRDIFGKRVYNIHDCSPDVAALLPVLREKSRHLMIKLSPMLDISQTIRDLSGTEKIYITGENNECREIIAIVGNNAVENVKIVAKTGKWEFEFTQEEEARAVERYMIPKEGEWLLEPSPIMMKAGAFKLLSERFDIAALHPNTHIYSSSKIIDKFPGRQSQIIEILKFTSSNLKLLKKAKLNADVAVRNFPYTADYLRSRLGINKSGTTRIIGVTAADSQQYLIILKT